MDLSTRISPEQTSSSPTTSRGPLLPKTMLTPQQLPKQVRRKSSFILRVDSSEECPSPHDSIYEAFYFSGTNSDESGSRVESWPMVTLRDPTPLEPSQHQVIDENSRGLGTSTNASATDSIEFRYGHGTILETITEQKSNTTMRTIVRTKSADHMPSIPFLGHRDSFILAKSPRRKKSFSVDDVALIKISYHEACAMIERTAQKPLPIHEIYAQPKIPILAPPERPPTPPGMPSWTASQNILPLPPPRRSSNQQPRLTRLQRVQRFFTSHENEIALSSHIPASSVDPGVRSVSAPAGGRTAPRFRPPRSAYGPIDQHPFNNAPLAKPDPSALSIPSSSIGSSNMLLLSNLPRPTRKIKQGQRVRFTPSATARDSEMISLRNAIESSSVSALHPMAPMQAASESTTISPKPRQCPHRRGRRAVLKALSETLNHESTTPPSNKDTVPPSQSPSRRIFVTSVFSPQIPDPSSSLISSRRESILDDEHEQSVLDPVRSRILSISSTAPLMSGALTDSPSTLPTPICTATNTNNVNEPKEKVASWCWKCKIEEVSEKMDRWWVNTTSCLCFVCCGVDVNEDLSVEFVRGGFGGAGMRSGGRQEMVCPPRRVILKTVPAVGL